MVRDSPPINVRRVGESREIVKQTDFGFGVDAQAGPGEAGGAQALTRFAHQSSPA